MKDFFCEKCNKQHKLFTTIEFGIPKDILLKILSEKLEVEATHVKLDTMKCYKINDYIITSSKVLNIL